MTQHPSIPDPMTCDAFLELLPDLLEGELAGPALAAATAHREHCAECGAVMAELELIRRSAAALPELRPSRDLWGGIAARIEAPVVPLAAGRPRAAAPSWYRRPWLAAAAVLLLVVGTAGITRQLTLRGLAGDAPAAAAAPASPAPTALAGAGDAGRDAPPPATPVVAAVPGAAPSGVDAPAAAPSPAARASFPGAGPRPAAAGEPTMQLASTAGTAGTALEAAAQQDRELATLRALLDQRRDSLDGATVRVLESNLDIIDQAIAESRAALMRDPSSRFLNERLSSALQDRLQLMRTAVLISND